MKHFPLKKRVRNIYNVGVSTKTVAAPFCAAALGQDIFMHMFLGWDRIYAEGYGQALREMWTQER